MLMGKKAVPQKESFAAQPNSFCLWIFQGAKPDLLSTPRVLCLQPLYYTQYSTPYHRTPRVK